MSLVVSVSGVCMVGIFSTRGEDDHSGSSIPWSNTTDAVINSSIGDAASQSSETNNTVLGILVTLIILNCVL